jgi:hypothetical protein
LIHNFDCDFDYDFQVDAEMFPHGLRLLWFSMHTIDSKAADANSMCAPLASAAHQYTQHPNVIKPDAANAAARPTKAL